jgi:hypothetical protein
MGKTKLTLSIDKEVIKAAKTQALLKDSNISSLVETFLKSIGESWVDELMEKLGVRRGYVSYEDVMKNRPRGSDAGKVIRALRYGREKRILGQ